MLRYEPSPQRALSLASIERLPVSDVASGFDRCLLVGLGLPHMGASFSTEVSSFFRKQNFHAIVLT